MKTGQWLLGVILAGAVTATAQDSPSSGTMPSAATGPVARWCFDDPDDLGADCDSHFDAVPVGAPQAINDGVVGGAVHLDGESWFDVPSPFFLDGLCSATVSAHLWLDKLEGSQQIIGGGDFRGGSDPLSFQIDGGRMTNVGYEDMTLKRGIKANWDDAVQHFETGRWYHLAVTLQPDGDGSLLLIYIDGEFVEETRKSYSVCIGYDIPMPTQLGAIHGIQTWHGKLDELTIHARTLNADEVRKLAGK